MLRNESNNNIVIGSMLILNYEKGREVFSKKVKLVKRYLSEKVPLRIEVGCTIGSFNNEEIFEFETLDGEKIVLSQSDFIDYIVL